MSEPSLSKPPLIAAVICAIGWAIAYFALHANTMIIIGLAVLFIGLAVLSFVLGRRDANDDQPIYDIPAENAVPVFGPGSKAANQDGKPDYSQMTPAEKKAAKAEAKAEKKRAAQEAKFQKQAEKEAAKAAKSAKKKGGQVDPETAEMSDWLQQIKEDTFIPSAQGDTTDAPKAPKDAAATAALFTGMPEGMAVPMPAPAAETPVEVEEEAIPLPVPPGEASSVNAETENWLDSLYDDDNFLAALNDAKDVAADDDGNDDATVDDGDVQDDSAEPPTVEDGAVAEDDEDEVFEDEASERWVTSTPVATVDDDETETMDADAALEPESVEDTATADAPAEDVTEAADDVADHAVEDDTVVAEAHPMAPTDATEDVDVTAEEPSTDTGSGEQHDTDGMPLLATAGSYPFNAPAEDDNTNTEEGSTDMTAVSGEFIDVDEKDVSTEVAARTAEEAQPVLVSDVRVAAVANQIAQLVSEAEWQVEQRAAKEIEAAKADADERIRLAQQEADEKAQAAQAAAEAQAQVARQEAEMKARQAAEQLAEMRRQADEERDVLAAKYEAELATKADKADLDRMANQNGRLSESLEEAESNLQQVIEANRTVADAAATSARLQAVARIRRLRQEMSDAGVDANALDLLDGVVDDFRK